MNRKIRVFENQLTAVQKLVLVEKTTMHKLVLLKQVCIRSTEETKSNI